MPIVGKEVIFFEPLNCELKFNVTFTKSKGFRISGLPKNVVEMTEYYCPIGHDSYDSILSEFRKVIMDYNKIWKNKNKEKIINIHYKEEASFVEEEIIIIFDYEILYKINDKYYELKDIGGEDYYREKYIDKKEYIQIKCTKETETFVREFKMALIKLQNNFKEIFTSVNKLELVIKSKQKLIEGLKKIDEDLI